MLCIPRARLENMEKRKISYISQELNTYSSDVGLCSSSYTGRDMITENSATTICSSKSAQGLKQIIRRNGNFEGNLNKKNSMLSFC
jgi:hypothetical protein